MRALDIFLFVFLLVAIIIMGYGYFWYEQALTKYAAEFTPIIPQRNNETKITDVINYSRSAQFYPNMRFSDNNISYGFAPECIYRKREDTRRAMDIIETSTILNFYESDDPEILVTCSNLTPEPKARGHFVVGEGGPVEVINTSLFSLIYKGKISLYRTDKCPKPNIATHELLHVLGFDHNDNPNSILYPILDCSQEIDKYIFDEINRIYSIPSAPDLIITKASASKYGRYVHFNVEILNQGLKNASNTTLKIYENDKLINEFDMGVIEPGTRKILNVKNLRVSKSIKTLSLIAKTPLEEIDISNNEFSLQLIEI